MVTMFTPPSATLVITVLIGYWTAIAVGHSWIECLDTDRSKVYEHAVESNFAPGACGGYSYNYPGRTPEMQNREEELMLVKILKEDFEQTPGMPICKPEPPHYTGEGYRKRLTVRPGERVYFAYMPNGHVAVDEAGRGTRHGIYWTGTPDTRLTFSSELVDARLVNGERLDFDDGNCGQTLNFFHEPSGRAGDRFPCVGSFMIPAEILPGVYSFVWGWKFWDEVNNRPYIETRITAVNQKTYGGAYYGSCFDVEVVDKVSAPIGNDNATTKIAEVEGNLILPVNGMITEYPMESESFV